MAEVDPKSAKQTYDQAKSHFMGKYPDVLPIERAYLHIGMYLGWIITQELYSEYFEEEAETQIIRFKRNDLPCTILSEIWDGYLGSDQLNAEGNAFTIHYYGSGQFLTDYRETLARELPSLYHVSDNRENFLRLAQVIDTRLAAWRQAHPL